MTKVEVGGATVVTVNAALALRTEPYELLTSTA
jgi:hypothetical protein